MPEDTENTENTETTEIPASNDVTADQCLETLVQIATSLIYIGEDIKQVRNSLVYIQAFIGGEEDGNSNSN